MSGPQSGGGSSPTTTQTSGLPEWAMPYAKDTLAKQAALSDVPYQPYGGNRIQGFTPMQQNAANQAANMQTSGITGEVANRGLNTQNFGADQAAQYMNPYMQNVVDIQKREAQRQSGIQGTQQQAQATQSGAFGGSRDAIMRAERERNLGQQMNDIQAQGSNAAYTNAQNQFNTDQSRAMQGLGLAGTAAGQQFQQGMDINKLQSAYGAQQQAMGQQGLNMAYQDFLNQKAYPQTQLSNMANMMRGPPIGTTQTTTGTPGSPSDLQTLGSLGMFGYGLSKFYAEGGSVDSQGNIESIVHKLSDQQLAQAEQSAKARGDAVEMQVIGMEKAARASMKRGIAAAPVNMEQMLPSEESMARGGIVAFGKGGDAEEEDDDSSQTPAGDNQPQGAGSPTAYQNALDQMQAQAASIANAKYEPMKSEEYDAVIKKRMAALQEGLPKIYDQQNANVDSIEADRAKNLDMAKGLAAFQAGAAMLQGNQGIRGLAAGAATFGDAYGAAVKADQAQKQALQQMKFNIADAQRKEQMGLMKDSIAAADQARRDHQAAQQFGIDKAKALGAVYKGIAATSRPGPAAKPPTPPKVAEATLSAAVKSAMAKEKPLPGETPEQQEARITAREGRGILAQLGTRVGSMVSDIGPTKAALTGTGLDINVEKDIESAVEKRVKQEVGTPGSEYRKADPAGKAALRKQYEDEARAKYPKSSAAKPAPAPAPAPAAPAAKIPEGATFGKAVPGKGTEVFVGGKLVGYAN